VSEVSIVIPSHGRSHLLWRVLAPLLADPATLEAIVVADDDPAAVEAVEALRDDRVRAVPVQVRDEAASRQAGLAVARGRVVLLLDDDVIAGPRLVTGHAAHHAEPGLVVFGYMPVHPEFTARRRAFPARLYAGTYEAQVRTWEAAPDRILHNYWAGNVSLRREDALRVGVRNPAYRGRYFIDHEFGMRCARAGLHGVFDRELAAWHLFEKRISQWRVESRRQGAAQALTGAVAQTDGLAAPGLDALVDGALLGVTYVAGAIGLAPAERRAARLLRRRDMDNGRRAVADGRAEAEGLVLPEVPS
jgi:glycosyltransferase involved in cell wall biosynthesis